MVDYWESGDMVFVTGGKRYGLTASLKTTLLEDKVCQDEKTASNTAQTAPEPVTQFPTIHLPTPTKNVTDNYCLICGSPVPGKRLDRKFCSARCRKAASRGKQLALMGAA